MLDSGRYLGSKKPPRMPLGLQLLSAFGTRGILERESQTGSIEWGGPGEEERPVTVQAWRDNGTFLLANQGKI